MYIPRHENVRGDYSATRTIPDRHPDSLYAIAMGEGLESRNLQDFSFSDLMFMYKCIKHYGLRVEPYDTNKRNRLMDNFAVVCDQIKSTRFGGR